MKWTATRRDATSQMQKKSEKSKNTPLHRVECLSIDSFIHTHSMHQNCYKDVSLTSSGRILHPFLCFESHDAAPPASCDDHQQ